MKFVTCFYDHKQPGKPWDLAIEMALAGFSPQERRRVQIICLPEIMRKRAKVAVKVNLPQRADYQKSVRANLPQAITKQQQYQIKD